MDWAYVRCSEKNGYQHPLTLLLMDVRWRTDHNWVQPIALTTYDLVVKAMFIVHAKDGACSTFYIGDVRFDHVSAGIFFQVPAKTQYALMYLVS